MLESTSTFRTRYAETDQMSVVYYGVYPQYFEVGRVEALRQIGMTYRKMEEEGIMMPVRKLEIEYHKPALYDEELTIRTFVREMPTSRITFEHEIFNPSGELLTTGYVQLVFINRETRRPCRCPENLKNALRPYYQ